MSPFEHAGRLQRRTLVVDSAESPCVRSALDNPEVQNHAKLGTVLWRSLFSELDGFVRNLVHEFAGNACKSAALLSTEADADMVRDFLAFQTAKGLPPTRDVKAHRRTEPLSIGPR